MATPDIGTTISDGYRRGIDRLPSIAPAALVPAVIVGVAAGVIAQLQDSLDSNAVFQLLGALSTAIQVVVTMAATAVFGGALHIARHQGEGTEEVTPAPGAMISSLSAAVASLMPKLGLIVLLSVAPALAMVVDDILGGLVGLAVLVLLIYFGIRWIYAPIIAGSGEATGDAAYARSEEVVSGSFWPTFGSFIVIGIAVGLPVALVGVVVGIVMPGVFLSALGATTVSVFGSIALYTTALESAWAQVEHAPTDGSDVHHGFDSFGTPTAGAVDPTVAPAVAPAGTGPVSDFDDLLEDSDEEAPRTT